MKNNVYYKQGMLEENVTELCMTVNVGTYARQQNKNANTFLAVMYLCLHMTGLKSLTSHSDKRHLVVSRPNF